VHNYRHFSILLQNLIVIISEHLNFSVIFQGLLPLDVVGVTYFRLRSQRLLARVFGMTPAAAMTQAN